MASYEAVTAYLKYHLKTQKISQKRLAQKMEMSESTLKKWMNAEDGSFNRLSQICDALGISLMGVMSSIEKKEVETFQFTDAQQSYFEKNFEHFKFYWLLAYERIPLEILQKKWKFSDSETKRLLLKLDQLGLLDMLPKDRLLLPQLRPVRWTGKGAFLKKLYRDWSMMILQDALETNDQLILQFFQLDEHSAQELTKDLRQLEEKYARKTIQELSFKNSKTQLIRFLACTAEGSFVPLKPR